MRSIVTRSIVTLVALLASAGVAAMAAEAPRPVITMTNVPTDPAKYAWLSDDGRKALAGAIDQHKSGSLFAFVFAGAPGDLWAYRSVASDGDLDSIDDIARQALEACEYYANMPCFIVSVNGLDVRDAAGGMPLQPFFLGTQPTEFDPRRVPFVSATAWSALRSYLSVTTPKAMVISLGGTAWWPGGDNLGAAVAAAYADCQKADANNVCILYAVNNRVVFTAGGPY